MKKLIMLLLAVLTQTLAPLYGQKESKQKTLIGANIYEDKLCYYFREKSDTIKTIMADGGYSYDIKELVTRETYTISPKLKGIETLETSELFSIYEFNKLCEYEGKTIRLSNIKDTAYFLSDILTVYLNRQYKNWEVPNSSSGLWHYKKNYIEYTPVLDKINSKVVANEKIGYRWYINTHLASYIIFSFIIYLMLCSYRTTHKIDMEIREEIGKKRMASYHTASIWLGFIIIAVSLATFIILHIKNIAGNRDFLINSFYNYTSYYFALIISFISLFQIKKMYTNSFNPNLNVYFFTLFSLVSTVFLLELRSESGFHNIGWFFIYEIIALMFLVPRAFDTTVAEKFFDMINSIDFYFWKLKHERKT